MKTLLLDAGNTRLKWATCVKGELSQQGSLSYEWPSLAMQLDTVLGRLLDESESNIGVTISNVAGPKLISALQKITSVTIRNVIAGADAYGVRCAYEQPSQLGADRWAGLVAARHHRSDACCIIDCGTAMTVDVLTVDGRHAGGVIIPGMDMMRTSLLENTQGISVNERANLSPLAVTNTSDAVQAGVFAAMQGTVQQVLQYCRDELGEEPVCVVTGGNAQRLLPVLPDTTTLEADWVLKGLAVIAAAED